MSPTPAESQYRPLNLSPRDVQKEYLLDMSPTPTKRVAIYARVSTLDKGQDPETQLLQLREYAGRRGFDIAGEYVDYATGTNEDRANYQLLLDAGDMEAVVRFVKTKCIESYRNGVEQGRASPA